MPRRLRSTHPGEVLREDFLLPMKLTPYAVARACGATHAR
jgi:plasmid maintenance system antidote protein VapI